MHHLVQESAALKERVGSLQQSITAHREAIASLKVGLLSSALSRNVVSYSTAITRLWPYMPSSQLCAAGEQI